MGFIACPCSPSFQWRTSSNTRVSAFHVTNEHALIYPARREDLNSLVKRHIQTVVTSTPNRALNILESDAADLIAAGMVTLNAKLMGVHDTKLIARVVETWNFFWDQVLTYVEGVSDEQLLLPFCAHPTDSITGLVATADTSPPVFTL